MVAKPVNAPPVRRLFGGKMYGLLEDTFATRGCSKQAALKAAADLRRGGRYAARVVEFGGKYWVYWREQF